MLIGWSLIVSSNGGWLGSDEANIELGLSSWLINAFNGEWLRTEDAVPMENIGAVSIRR